MRLGPAALAALYLRVAATVRPGGGGGGGSTAQPAGPCRHEPRRLYTVLEFLLFADTTNEPQLGAKGALLLLLSRYGDALGVVPPPLLHMAADAERHSRTFTFRQFLNSPLAIAPPQWRVP
eukprot:SAG25_NODE_1243_length_3513_cov_82.771822_3_plen_121_part_00